MSRWRPPQSKSTAIISARGLASLKQELNELWAKRRVVNRALAAAAAEGDRSENAEYIYRKKEQAQIDRRIRYLQKRIPELNVVERVANTNQIYFGATVRLLKNNCEPVQVTLLGPDETNTQNNEISIDSPLAKALLKKHVGDEIEIQVANKTVLYQICEISY